MSMKHKLVFLSMILITILCISSVSVVSASSLENDLTDNALSDTNLQKSLESLDNNENDLSNPLNEAIESNSNSADLKMEDSNWESKILKDADDEEEPDTPDLNPDESSDDINYVYQSNIKKYFPNGILDSKYENKALVFIGNFEDMGKLTINSPNVNITGLNANLKNVVFDIQRTDVSLSNLNLVLDEEFKENHGAAIFVASDNVN